MESQQTRYADDYVFDLRPHNSPEYRCVVCNNPTTFRYGSIPVCAKCAEKGEL